MYSGKKSLFKKKTTYTPFMKQLSRSSYSLLLPQDAYESEFLNNTNFPL